MVVSLDFKCNGKPLECFKQGSNISDLCFTETYTEDE